MLRSLLPLLGVLLAAEASPAQRLTSPTMPITLFTFDRDDEPDWEVVNDGVMGGRSSGFVAVAEGRLRFSGTLVTQGGGFTSARAPMAVDLSGLQGLELRVRGSGRSFELELNDGTRGYGRNVSRRAAFATTAEWTVVRVPFSALRSSIFGRVVSAPRIDLTQLRSVGLYILDGRDGPFWLEVDYIRGYGAGA
jgi:NADH dehydrogenase [ubiquinone] 1 alpha subcomplex assembly factor 1